MKSRHPVRQFSRRRHLFFPSQLPYPFLYHKAHAFPFLPLCIQNTCVPKNITLIPYVWLTPPSPSSPCLVRREACPQQGTPHLPSLSLCQPVRRLSWGYMWCFLFMTNSSLGDFFACLFLLVVYSFCKFYVILKIFNFQHSSQLSLWALEICGN